jgi:hypothetical protein
MQKKLCNKVDLTETTFFFDGSMVRIKNYVWSNMHGRRTPHNFIVLNLSSKSCTEENLLARSTRDESILLGDTDLDSLAASVDGILNKNINIGVNSARFATY